MDDRIHRINENLQVGGIIRLDITLNDHFGIVGTSYRALTLLFCEWDRPEHKDWENSIIFGNLIWTTIMGTYFEKCYIRFIVFAIN